MTMTARPVEESDAGVAARRALASARLPRVLGPGPAPGQARRAYLDLLKLALCDLVAGTTISVGRVEDGMVASREITDEQLGVRALGMDWPLQGLTMIGLDRLDDLQRCVESVVGEQIPGDLIEAGVWRGGAAILARATLDSLGANDRTVWVADSFRGFPRAAGSEDRWEQIDYLSVSSQEVLANFERLGLDRGVRIVEGFFADTLPTLRENRWALVRLDGDTYESTCTALEALYPGLVVGGYLIVDDYGALRECRAAVDEFRAAHGIKEPLEQVDWTCVRWRREEERFDAARSARPQPTAREQGSAPRPRAAGREERHVPSFRELALEQELASVREQTRAYEAELARLRARPLSRLRERVRRELGAGGRS